MVQYVLLPIDHVLICSVLYVQGERAHYYLTLMHKQHLQSNRDSLSTSKCYSDGNMHQMHNLAAPENVSRDPKPPTLVKLA